jgi:hypothetical protein
MNTSNEKSIEKCLGNIHGIFDPGTKCLGKNWRIVFSEKDLVAFVSDLEYSKRESLSSLIAFFGFNMSPLSRLNTEISNDGLNNFLGPKAWSNFALVIIMSILEKHTKGKYDRKDFLGILSANLPIISKEQLVRLSEEQIKTNPPVSVLRFSTLFKNNLEQNEIDKIIKNYRAEKGSNINAKIDSIEAVFKNLWEEVRSGFIHGIGTESIYNEDTIFKLSTMPGTLTVENNLSMSNFLFLSWKAIFRDFGYKGEINSNFTKEELEAGVTANGIKL